MVGPHHQALVSMAARSTGNLQRLLLIESATRSGNPISCQSEWTYSTSAINS